MTTITRQTSDKGQFGRESATSQVGLLWDSNKSNTSRITMPASDYPKPPKKKCIAITAAVVLAIAIPIACLIDSYHKIHEGYVGIYFRHGALQNSVSEPGVHLMRPFVENYREVKIRP